MSRLFRKLVYLLYTRSYTMSNMLDAAFINLAPEPPPSASPGYEVPLHVEPDCLHLLFDEISHGVLVISPKGRVLHSNRAARDEMTRNGVLFVSQDELQTMSPMDGKLLHAALAKASGGVRSLVKLSGSGITLMLSAIPLKHRPGSTCEQIALFFERRGICDTGMFVFFARSHRLTRTEEQVLNLLCRGMSTPDIAKELDVAVSTVRSHVRSLCIKTGAKGAREMVNRIATLPPVGATLRLEMH
jgi:DNA-binding CsgD family transcriptional regulator